MINLLQFLMLMLGLVIGLLGIQAYLLPPMPQEDGYNGEDQEETHANT